MGVHITAFGFFCAESQAFLSWTTGKLCGALPAEREGWIGRLTDCSSDTGPCTVRQSIADVVVVNLQQVNRQRAKRGGAGRSEALAARSTHIVVAVVRVCTTC